MSVWKSDETLLSICILNFSFKNDFVWEEISNIRHSVSSPDETPRSSSKIIRCTSYFQLPSHCFIWWWNTTSHAWYITWKIHSQNNELLYCQVGNLVVRINLVFSLLPVNFNKDFPLANTFPWPFVPILSNSFEKKRTQNHPQCLSGLSRALFPTTFPEIAV